MKIEYTFHLFSKFTSFQLLNHILLHMLATSQQNEYYCPRMNIPVNIVCNDSY